MDAIIMCCDRDSELSCIMLENYNKVTFYKPSYKSKIMTIEAVLGFTVFSVSGQTLFLKH